MEFELFSPLIRGTSSTAFEKCLSELRDVNPIGEAPHHPLLLLTVLKAAERVWEVVGRLVAVAGRGLTFSENRRTQNGLSAERQVYGTPAAPSAGFSRGLDIPVRRAMA